MKTNISLWLDQYPNTKTFPKLKERLEAEVCVIGGGITGLLTAYFLSLEGKNVILLEKDRLYSGESAYTTAFLTYMLDVPLIDLAKRFGQKKATAAYQANKDGIAILEEIVRRENIACEFIRCPVRIFAKDNKDAGKLKREAELAKAAGFPTEFEHGVHAFERYGVLEVRAQAKFHPTKFLQGVVAALEKRGVKIFENARVTTFGGKEKNTVQTNEGSVTAHEVVIATHVPIDNKFEVPARVEGYQSYVIAGTAPKGTLPEGLFWDTADPYQYLRIDARPEHDRLILGGFDHKTGQKKDSEHIWRELEKYLHEILKIENFTLEYRWSGQVFETADMLPYIGRSMMHKHHLIASGYAGNGMTFGTIAAKTMADLIVGRENAWAQLFSPKRVKGFARLGMIGFDFIRHLVTGQLKKKGDMKDLGPGDGAVIAYHGKKAAVSKDHRGNITAVSPVCTHLGCHVEWNKAATTWDCPCHGSRFSAQGQVISGPAREPLKKIE